MTHPIRDAQHTANIHKEQTSEIVSTALELGVNHFDVAESHAGKQKTLKSPHPTCSTL